jgi:hypothetical protein
MESAVRTSSNRCTAQPLATRKQFGGCPGSKHTGGIDARPVEYEQRGIAFFDGALLGDANGTNP